MRSKWRIKKTINKQRSEKKNIIFSLWFSSTSSSFVIFLSTRQSAACKSKKKRRKTRESNIHTLEDVQFVCLPDRQTSVLKIEHCHWNDPFFEFILIFSLFNRFTALRQVRSNFQQNDLIKDDGGIRKSLFQSDLLVKVVSRTNNFSSSSFF